MAIYHCSIKPISRGAGRSAVAAIAYRTASRIVNERENVLYDFTAKRGVDHCEIVLPDGMEAGWALDRSTLWNAAETAERRLDARVAREFEIALPHELNDAQRLSLTRAFARDLANKFGTAVDFAIHVPVEARQGQNDGPNIHAHLMMTTRVITPSGFAEKAPIERENRWLIANDLPTSHIQMREVRQMLAHHINRHLLQAGLDRRVDHRSHPDRGLDLEPTGHVGVHASQMRQRGIDVARSRIEPQAASRNAEVIRRRPEQVLSLLTDERSVFDRRDIARTLSRYIAEPDAFHIALAAVMASSQLVELQAEADGEPARYSTRQMIETEHRMAALATHMAGTHRHAVRDTAVARAITVENRQLPGSGLSDEQQEAVRHVTGPQQIAAVIGFAGAGKSTMLAAARRAWELQGYRVHGAALAGKAAAGLSASSGIAARTLASWELGWTNGKGTLGRDDIMVIDEAGMIGSKQLTRFVQEVQARGAKLVLVGDHEQLQAIGAGSPFRAITERIGAAGLTDIRRQTADWQRLASRAFATHRTADGLTRYAERGAVLFTESREAARDQLVRDYLADLTENPDTSRIALAHRRVDVRAINDAIRSALHAEGLLAKGVPPGGEIDYETVNGKRAFASGDRIVLLQNNRDLNVKNGMLGTVEAVEPDAIQIRLDGSSGGHNDNRVLILPAKDYRSFDHGYATTIHKAQGATVDRSFVIASASMDRHLTYVAMTRHRHRATLYAGRDEIRGMKDLTASLSRSGLKETTLDYTDAFAERRGIGEHVEKEKIKATIDRQPEVPAPLIAAISRYDRSVEEIARDTAMPHLERSLENVRSVGRHVYCDPFAAAVILRNHILEGTATPDILARAVRERPDQFGPLRGSSGLFGDNGERRQALSSARALANHVEAAAETWTRQFDLARTSETWQREKRDVIQVPGISPPTEAILRAFDTLTHDDRPAFLKQLSSTPDGQKALQDVAEIAQALTARFGTADLRNVDAPALRRLDETNRSLERIRHVARLADRLHDAELTRKHTLSKSLTKGLRL